MPLRDLPTESKAAAALLRTENLQYRRTLRRTQWQGVALACLSVGSLLAVLLPGPASTDCYLWRATSQPVSGRGAALALPLALVALVLVDRLCADRIQLRRQVRGWGAVALVLVSAAAWTGLAAQGRTGCSTSPAVIGVVVCGGLAASIAAYWATRVPDSPMLLDRPGQDTENSSEEPLDQSELRAAFLRMSALADCPAVSRPAVVPLVTGALAALLLLSTVLPWRELLDPVALGPAGAEAGLSRVQLRRWELAVVLVIAAGAGLLLPAAAAPEDEPEAVAGAPHRLLELQGGQLVDRLGMRVAVATSDPLDSIAGTLDGTPGEWLLGRTGSEVSTLFEYRDGVALPRVSLSHGVTPPARTT